MIVTRRYMNKENNNGIKNVCLRGTKNFINIRFTPSLPPPPPTHSTHTRPLHPPIVQNP